MHGFGLSIDDYGTGYSSLQQLVRIPYSELKVDQSFVTRAAIQESSRVVVASSLEMARKLMITSVAEGIESQDDWNFLAELGCDIAQGYFTSQPMAADEFLRWALNFSETTSR
jgi:EAL domain-containing protein (putative c-di-GMP-specific phosphodiesterase class I)